MSTAILESSFVRHLCGIDSLLQFTYVYVQHSSAHNIFYFKPKKNRTCLIGMYSPYCAHPCWKMYLPFPSGYTHTVHYIAFVSVSLSLWSDLNKKIHTVLSTVLEYAMKLMDVKKFAYYMRTVLIMY